MKKERLTLGYLAPRFFQGFNVGLFTSVINAAAEMDLNFMCFSGPSNMSPEYVKQHNIVFDLLDPDKIDGIICWTSGLYQQGGYLFNIENFFKKYNHIPFVSIERAVEGHPVILIDNYHGVSSLLNHLVNEHQYKKIGFVRGPEFHSSAVNRYMAFLDSMKKNNVPVIPELVTDRKSTRLNSSHHTT
jgi:DNA-binding LacI/PurR family transcriptional regulator